jgi:hypothetical protein
MKSILSERLIEVRSYDDGTTRFSEYDNGLAHEMGIEELWEIALAMSKEANRQSAEQLEQLRRLCREKGK